MKMGKSDAPVRRMLLKVLLAVRPSASALQHETSNCFLAALTQTQRLVNQKLTHSGNLPEQTFKFKRAISAGHSHRTIGCRQGGEAVQALLPAWTPSLGLYSASWTTSACLNERGDDQLATFMRKA
eukprot:6208267-Pleurochrysis_carterae.AAC.3